MVSVLSHFFDLEAPFDGVPLFMAHSAFTPCQPSPLASMESDPSEASSFLSLTPSSGGSGSPAGGPKATNILENGFLTLELD